MKTRLFIFCLLLFSCNGKEKDQRDFKWLLGDWKRINETQDLRTFESWKKNSENEYEGFGFSLKKSDTVFKERMYLRKEAENWSLVISGVNEEPTVFNLTDIEKRRFVAENPENEFPKKITYFDNVNSLNAIISGDGKEIIYKFEKMEHPSEIKESILNMLYPGF